MTVRVNHISFISLIMVNSMVAQVLIVVKILTVPQKIYTNLTITHSNILLKTSHMSYKIISLQQIEAHFAQIHTLINQTLQLVAVRLAVNYFPFQLTNRFPGDGQC